LTIDEDEIFAGQPSVNKRITIMKNSKIATAAVMLCTLSFGAFAANPSRSQATPTIRRLVLPKRPMLKPDRILLPVHNQPVTLWMMHLMSIPLLPASGPDFHL
jgi:hypothetical protein